MHIGIQKWTVAGESFQWYRQLPRRPTLHKETDRQQLIASELDLHCSNLLGESAR
jgi:hypothetical protein